MVKEFSPEEYFDRLSSLIKEFTTSYFKLIIDQIREKEEFRNEPKTFYYTVVNKINCSLDAANIFVRNFDTNPHLHTALFVIIRSILNDIILVEYVINNSEDEEKEKELIKRIYFDHVDNAVFAYKKIYPVIHDWDEDKTDRIINDIKTSKSHYYNENGEPLLKPFASSPYKIVKSIFSSKKKKDYHFLKLAFDQYMAFSKFEHFGDLTLLITHQGYYKNRQPHLRSELHYSIRIIIAALRNYAQVWENDFDTKNEYFFNLEDKITQFLPD